MKEVYIICETSSLNASGCDLYKISYLIVQDGITTIMKEIIINDVLTETFNGTEYHGLTYNDILQYGIPMKQALYQFLTDTNRADIFYGAHVNFHFNVIKNKLRGTYMYPQDIKLQCILDLTEPKFGSRLTLKQFRARLPDNVSKLQSLYILHKLCS